MTFKELREKSGMNLTQFSAYFEIPYRTIQHWEYGTRQCPEHLLKLMQYKLDQESKKEKILKEYADIIEAYNYSKESYFEKMSKTYLDEGIEGIYGKCGKWIEDLKTLLNE